MLLLTGLLVALTGFADAEEPADELLALLAGEFTSVAQGQPGNGENPLLTHHNVRITAPELGAHVVYMQLNSGPAQKVARQRILVFEPAADGGHIRQLTWSLAMPEAFVNGWDRPEVFAELTTANLVRELSPGCEQVWEQRAAGWFGRVDAEQCRIWSKGRATWLSIEAEVLVTRDAYMTAERGFNDAGEQVFGTAAGEYYVLQRR